MRYFVIVLLLCGLLFSSCQSITKGEVGLAGGTAVGAVLGQAIGRNTKATLIGAAIGGVLGYIAGNEMDKYDRQKIGQVYEMTPSGKTSSWVNPDTGREYSVTPHAAYQSSGAYQVCRDADVEVVIDGRRQTSKATACRDSNGDWRLQS